MLPPHFQRRKHRPADLRTVLAQKSFAKSTPVGAAERAFVAARDYGPNIFSAAGAVQQI